MKPYGPWNDFRSCYITGKLTLFLDLGERLSNEETFPKYNHPCWNIYLQRRGHATGSDVELAGV